MVTGGAPSGQRGAALVIVVLVMMLMSALGLALALDMMVQVQTAAAYRDGLEAHAAAEAGIELAVQELAATPDWTPVLAGALQSRMRDGPPGGERTLADGTVLNLTEATYDMRCGRRTPCSDAEMDAVTADRPWGPNNPRWQLYAYGPMQMLLAPGGRASRVYLAMWVADDPAENDAAPLVDGEDASNPGRGLLLVHAQAHGASGARRIIEATVSRDARLVSWREVR